MVAVNRGDLSDIRLFDPGGEVIRLGDVIDRPTVIDLVRYYGCAPCRQYLMRLADEHPRIRQQGGDVLGVGPRASYQARLLIERGRVPFRLLLDPDHALGTAIGLGRQSFWHFITDLRAWRRWLRAFFRSGQGLVSGGWWELPAIIVIDADCRLRWSYLGRSMGDYPPLETTLAELERVMAET